MSSQPYNESVSAALAGTAFECLLIEIFDEIIVTELGLMGQLALGQTSKAMHSYLIGDKTYPRRAFIPRQWKIMAEGSDHPGCDDRKASLEFEKLLLEACHSIMDQSKGTFRDAGRDHLVMLANWMKKDDSNYHSDALSDDNGYQIHECAVSFYHCRRHSGVLATFAMNVRSEWTRHNRRFVAIESWHFSRPIPVDNLQKLFSAIRMEPDVIRALASMGRIKSTTVQPYIKTALATRAALSSIKTSIEKTTQFLKHEYTYFPIPTIDDTGTLANAVDSLHADLTAFLQLRAQFHRASSELQAQMPRLSESLYTPAELNVNSELRRADFDPMSLIPH